MPPPLKREGWGGFRFLASPPAISVAQMRNPPGRRRRPTSLCKGGEGRILPPLKREGWGGFNHSARNVAHSLPFPLQFLHRFFFPVARAFGLFAIEFFFVPDAERFAVEFPLRERATLFGDARL